MGEGMLKDGIAPGRLAPDQYATNFSDLHPPLDKHEAFVEADRCYFCYDAPCQNACPTSIDIPLFIREILTDNPLGAAETIFEQNILGGMCARVCPTEQLCEEACVREAAEGKPVKIGMLQRYATDAAMRENVQFFARGAETGKHVAIVGAGPAGLACAHRLSMHGHKVTIFDARPKPGGLNEYGIAFYKTPGGFAQHEVDYVTAHGTSTPLNDATETLAIKRVFGDHAYRIAVSGTKGYYGHALGASGAIEAAICALALTNDWLPPTVNLAAPDDGCDLDYIPRDGRAAAPELLMSNSFGFGGINAALVMKKAS